MRETRRIASVSWRVTDTEGQKEPLLGSCLDTPSVLVSVSSAYQSPRIIICTVRRRRKGSLHSSYLWKRSEPFSYRLQVTTMGNQSSSPAGEEDSSSESLPTVLSSSDHEGTSASPRASNLSLKRTTSNRHFERKGEKRFIPSGLTERNNHGIIAPRQSLSSDQANGGMESPDFGWYVRTTPEQRFYSVRSKLPSFKEIQHPAVDFANSQPNEIFQRLQEKHKQAPTGNMPVPL